MRRLSLDQLAVVSFETTPKAAIDRAAAPFSLDPECWSVTCGPTTTTDTTPVA